MKIVVLLGGTSAERDVSIVSGLRIAEALRRTGHDVTAVDTVHGALTPAREAALLAGGVQVAPPSAEALAAMRDDALLASADLLRAADVVYLGLHGGKGEDGTVQGFLDLLGVRYTGSGPMASGIAMDKDLTKRLLRDAGIPTAAWRMAPVPLAEVQAALGLPLVVKPSKQGSTVGLSVVKRWEDLDAAVTEAFRHDDEVMLEAFVPGRELTVPVLAGEALPVGEIIPKHEIYDYECKYTPGMATEVFPADLPPEITAEAQRLAAATFRALKLRGCARIDFRLTPEGRLFVLEANTLPGMTALSLVPQSAAAAGIPFDALCERIVQAAAASTGGAS